jgi:hypothetical protein
MRLIPPGGGHGVAVSIMGTIGFLNKSAKAISLLIRKLKLNFIFGVFPFHVMPFRFNFSYFILCYEPEKFLIQMKPK